MTAPQPISKVAEEVPEIPTELKKKLHFRWPGACLVLKIFS
jgi:hypothetical protein